MTERPPPEDLERVADGEHILRFIHPTHYERGAEGRKIQVAALQSKDLLPNPNSYGASVYVETRASAAQVRAVYPKRNTFGVARVPVSELRWIGVDVVLSPQDEQAKLLSDAHATLLGVSRTNRDEVLDVIDRYVVEEPEPIPA